jgi:hypothetical protein
LDAKVCGVKTRRILVTTSGISHVIMWWFVEKSFIRLSNYAIFIFRSKNRVRFLPSGVLHQLFALDSPWITCLKVHKQRLMNTA